MIFDAVKQVLLDLKQNFTYTDIAMTLNVSPQSISKRYKDIDKMAKNITYIELMNLIEWVSTKSQSLYLKYKMILDRGKHNETV